MIITFLTTVTEEAAAARRRLGRFHRRLAGETTTIEAKIFMPDQASADAAEALLPTDAASVQALPAFSGLEVTAYEVRLPEVEHGPSRCARSRYRSLCALPRHS